MKAFPYISGFTVIEIWDAGPMGMVAMLGGGGGGGGAWTLQAPAPAVYFLEKPPASLTWHTCPPGRFPPVVSPTPSPPGSVIQKPDWPTVWLQIMKVTSQQLTA